jgi:Ni,Fe-hydrogenase III large subunit
MTPASNIIRSTTSVACLPWPRHVLDAESWAAMTASLADENLTLLAEWADAGHVHALLLDEVTRTVLPVSTPVTAGRYGSLAAARPGAAWFERMIADLWGHAAGAPAPWLDHGRWPAATPMRPTTGPGRRPEEPARHGTLMQLPLGPVWGRIEEAAELRLTLRGGTVAAAEARLGFTHKGTLALIQDKPPRTAARFAARLSGDSTVAHATAFATAAEAALGVTPPPRAASLRRIMGAVERIAGHLDTLTEVARLAGDDALAADCGLRREHLARAAGAVFGHRLMMDCVIPGGVAAEVGAAALDDLARTLEDLAGALPALRRRHEGSALAVRLRDLGRVAGSLATRFGASGVVAVPADALDRQRLRVELIETNIRLVNEVTDTLADGPLTATLPRDSGEGIGHAMSHRGEIWHWLRLEHGQITACFPRDPGWALWPLAERVLLGADAEDVDLIRASLALPASGMDL